MADILTCFPMFSCLSAKWHLNFETAMWQRSKTRFRPPVSPFSNPNHGHLFFVVVDGWHLWPATYSPLADLLTACSSSPGFCLNPFQWSTNHRHLFFVCASLHILGSRPSRPIYRYVITIWVAAVLRGGRAGQKNSLDVIDINTSTIVLTKESHSKIV